MAADRHGDDVMHMPVWKSYLYHLQQQAPKPKRIVCQREVPNKPPYYGREFHGALSREDTDFLLTIGGEGSYLIRESQRAPGQYTLAIRFEGVTKNFKLYYDGQHYVGEKRFDTVQDLVADGLITFYLESKAADYIAALSSQSNYAESPYVAYNTHKRRQLSQPKPSRQQQAARQAGSAATNATGAGSASAAPADAAKPAAPETSNATGSGSQGSAGSGSRGSDRSAGSTSSAPERPEKPDRSSVAGPDRPERPERTPPSTSGEARSSGSSGAASSGPPNASQLANAGSTSNIPIGTPRTQRVNLPVEGRLSQLLETRNAVVVDKDGGGGSGGQPVIEQDGHVDNRVSHSTNTDGPMLDELPRFSTPPSSPPPSQHVQGFEKQHAFKVSSVSWCNDFLEVMGSEKPHTFKQITFKGPHWCDFCANFLWGLIAQGVKCQDCGFNAHKKCSEKVPNDCMPDMKYVKRMFGVDLTTLVKAQNTLIPIVAEMCIKEIEARGVDSEGIYRVAGFHDDVEAIKMTFDKDGELTDISQEKYEDINTITSVLKLYFRLLPIPLITFDIYYKVMDTVSCPDNDSLSLEEKIQHLTHILLQLPPAHYHTLKYLMSHLHRCTEHQQKNMMSAENLAIVFAPTLLRSPETDPLIGLTAVKFERELIELLINHQGKIFEG